MAKTAFREHPGSNMFRVFGGLYDPLAVGGAECDIVTGSPAGDVNAM